MTEKYYEVSERSSIFSRTWGKVALSGALVFGAPACSSGTECGGTYVADQETTMVNRQFPTPDGPVDLSYNTDRGHITHVFLQKGPDNVDLNEADLKRGPSEFTLPDTTLTVKAEGEQLEIICKPN